MTKNILQPFYFLASKLYGNFLFFFGFLIMLQGVTYGQVSSGVDQEASTLLQKVTEKYKQYKNVSADFKLYVQRPKPRSEDDDRKYADTLKGKILLQQAKFNISINNQQIICDGKNIWTFIPDDREVQVNYFEETEDVFSPSKIFAFQLERFTYQVKEKKSINGKPYTVVEMSPMNKKVSFFKMDLTIDDATLQIAESKIYEKNGARYLYKISRQSFNLPVADDSFTFDNKRYPGVKVIDLR